MASVSFADLKLRSRERADMVNSTFVSDAELGRYINASVQELYDLLIATRGENYYVSSYSFNTVAGTENYALPSGFLKLMGVDWVQSSTNSFSMQAFKWQERNASYEGFFGSSRYQIRGNNLSFHPIPTGVQAVKIWYIPAATILVADADTFDGINGWEEYAIIDGAIKMCIKEETSVTDLVAAKKEMKARIMQASAGRDSLEPPRVIDVDGYWPWI